MTLANILFDLGKGRPCGETTWQVRDISGILVASLFKHDQIPDHIALS
jgi:hypothetical protein